MAQINDLNVDTKYSSIVEPNLYADSFLIPNVVFTNKYQEGPAGQIMVHKMTKGSVSVKAPGNDFTDEDVEDTLIPITLNNCYQKSEKIYGAQANAVAFNIGEETIQKAVKTIKEAREEGALACLAEEGTTVEDTDDITSDNVVEKLIALRKAVKDKKGNPNYALVSTDVYAKLLGKVGLQSYADPAVVSAELIKRFGLSIIECNAFGNEEAEYYDNTGTKKTVDLSAIDMIVGNGEAFSIVDLVNMARLRDSELFNGVKAQVEIVSGMTVTNADCILVKTHGTVSA